jgi:hypothetical protein
VTAEEYVRRVDFRLRDLPWRMRRDLIDELRGHLDELPADTDLAARLGPPEQRQNRPFRLGIRVQNTGAFTVRVLGVPIHPQPSGGWFGHATPPELPVSARLMMSGPLQLLGATHGPYTRFHPFDLKPGEVRLLFLTGVYGNCRNWGGGVAYLVDFPVRFRFLWRTTTVHVPLPQQLAIVLGKGFRCRATP